jgi:hypothetical protein
MRHILLSSAVLLGVPVALFAQSSETRPDVRTQEQATEAFLSQRAQQQEEREARIQDQANLRGLNGLVRAISFPRPKPAFVKNAEQVERLEASFVIEIAQLLSQLGFKAGDLRSSSDGDASVVRAAAAYIRGEAGISDIALLADTVVIGRVTQTSADASMNDEFRSTITLDVTDVTKRPADRRGEVAIRRLSGPSSGGYVSVSTEDEFAPGEQVVLLGSAALYSNERGREANCRACVVELVPLYRLDGDQLIPTATLVPIGSLEDLEQ